MHLLCTQAAVPGTPLWRGGGVVVVVEVVVFFFGGGRVVVAVVVVVPVVVVVVGVLRNLVLRNLDSKKTIV